MYLLTVLTYLDGREVVREDAEAPLDREGLRVYMTLA